jgi:NAD(P)-dependent dehydrogenase (short-subunit alcohol dehydrogenase family)
LWFDRPVLRVEDEMGQLEGKVAVVTGGGSGIGEATAKRFAAEGARVVVLDQDAEGGERVVSEIQAAGGEAAFLRAELERDAEALALAPFTVERFRALHILVNVAGARVYGPVTEATEESWDLILGVNVKALGLCAKAAIPEMAKAGGGAIVNVSSANAIKGRAGMAQYDASKAAVLGLTRSLAHDHAAQQIRVNAVCPGPTITQFHIKRAVARGSSEAELRAHTPTLLKRQAEPREIAAAILFLASDEASYITGATLMVDGGLSC